MPKMKLLSVFLVGKTKVNILALTAVSKSKIRLTSYIFVKLRIRS